VDKTYGPSSKGLIGVNLMLFMHFLAKRRYHRDMHWVREGSSAASHLVLMALQVLYASTAPRNSDRPEGRRSRLRSQARKAASRGLRAPMRSATAPHGAVTTVPWVLGAGAVRRYFMLDGTFEASEAFDEEQTRCGGRTFRLTSRDRARRK
jgi:hypothetical protein